ncbi:hypothetical protein BU26DRAFT_593003 [Trematosphaeria pertusa]|uniref:HNH nuclease domain-containing protein n=1 Tax=Trematosphaeria pertusa TaxID=390896 RepID=A0A6A6IJD8_9PLEO|nr:uncharacterized protein BU26DRAFT_593003 [Trematosphaeria pertusa]KAF2249690.1 hypothetical protein BU26DRAFT_593003 [Trematosphaeria pertusa]
MDSVYPGWENLRPEGDAESFTQRSSERRQLFDEAKRLGRYTGLHSIVWAFLQVADLEQVKQYVQDGILWDRLADPLAASFIEVRAKDVVLLWKQEPAAKEKTATGATSPHSVSDKSSNPFPSSPLRTQAATPSDTSPTRSKSRLGGREFSPTRVESVADRCKERDGHLCAVSRMAAVDAAHIYPWCAFGGKTPKRVVNFWDVLRMFWSPEKVDGWRAKIFQDPRQPNRGTETVENMLTFTATLHRFHSAGVFALRPVQKSADNTQLELEFHWLVREERKSTTKVDLLDEPLSSINRMESGNGYGPFIRIGPADGSPIILRSGTRFTLSTDDVTNKPLPDPGLLELQWHLQRIVAMSGAAGWRDLDYFDDDDDNDGTGVAVRDTVDQWLEEIHDVPADSRRGRSPPASESGDSVDGSSE